MKLTIQFPHDEVQCEHLVRIAHDLVMQPGNERTYCTLFAPEEWAEQEIGLIPATGDEDRDVANAHEYWKRMPATWPERDEEPNRQSYLVAWLCDGQGFTTYSEPWYFNPVNGTYFCYPG